MAKSVMKTKTELLNQDPSDDKKQFFSAVASKRGKTKTDPRVISVEQYTKERYPEIAILPSLKSTNMRRDFIDLSLENRSCCYVDDYDVDSDDRRVLEFKPLSATSVKKENKKKRDFVNSVSEKGQSSKSKRYPYFICDICIETKSANESFSIQGCTHTYCSDCMAKYIASKLEENITNISCPVSGCAGLLEPEHCRSILPQEVFDRWGFSLCEALIIGSQKFYCPFKDCSAMLVNDGTEVIRESECPNCRRLFCAKCKVPWHAEIDCEKFQALHKDEREREDIMLMKLADNKQWKRCPNCRIYVERTQGCRYMKCRCGAHFCYNCGSTEISSTYHTCKKCNG